MVKIGFLTDIHFDNNVTSKIEKELGIKILNVIVDINNTRQLENDIQKLEQDDCDIIVCRGVVEKCIKKIGCNVPYMAHMFSASETMHILNMIQEEYKAEFAGRIPKVGLVSHQPLYIDEQIFSNAFKMNIKNFVIESEKKEVAKALIQRLIDDDYDIIACGHSLKILAEEMGMRAFFKADSQSYELRREGFRTALQIANANIEMKQKKKELEILIDYSFNSVMTLDENGFISICNMAAIKLFKLRKEEIIREHICNIIPQIQPSDIQMVLEKGTNIFGRIIDIGHAVIVVNVNPVVQNDSIKGAVANFIILRENEKINDIKDYKNQDKGHGTKYTFNDIIGESPAILESKRLARQFAKYDSNVLILGETGTGKELFAQSIHNNSLRRNESFVAVNCGAIPLNLLESELFGYEEGAFTGASKKGKKGLIELADKGSLFLDEISEMDLHAQIRLLRVLEERVFTRVGGNRVNSVNIRVIAASNKNLMHLIDKGEFREDLFYRLNVLTLYVPPLRKRADDTILLTNYFLQVFGKTIKKNVYIEETAKEIILNFNWKGNIRQLKNFCERLLVIAEKNIISTEFVIKQLQDIYMVNMDDIIISPPIKPEEVGEINNEIKVEISEEKKAIVDALNTFGGSRKKTAAFLGISKATLWRKMNKYEIDERF